ncbi:MAG TPA: lactonase family protein [Candidatus Acidoferrales bacterium]|nr:lactonase family protein [Candidatus Acidoferrales bacterium]
MNDRLSRRDLLAVTGAALAGATAASAFQSKKLYAYVSSWTKGPFGAGGGGGITAFTVNMSDGSLTQVFKTGPEFDGLNGGNLCISANGRFLYCTHEAPNLNGKAGAGGGVHAFAINQENGSLTHLDVQPSMGVNPCFIIVDKTGNRVLVANHGDLVKAVRVVKRNGVPAIENPTDDGTVSMFAVNSDGSLEPACDVAVFERRPLTDPPGPGAAAHSVNFDNTGRWVIACDVGTNHIYVYPFDPAARTLGMGKVFPTPPDRAPRHSAIHPRLPYFFITNERESILSSFHFDSKTGDVSPINTVPTIPADFKERNALADIRLHPNGKFVYGSNRGHDSLVIVRIEEGSGKMIPVDIASTLGGNPREFDFEPSGKFLFVGNQTTNQMVTFAADPGTGKITPTGARAEISKPACVKFVML